MKATVVFVFLLIGYCTSFQQEATYYTGYDCTGESLTIHSKRADLHALSPEIIANHKSRAFWGRWKGYRELNFEGLATGGKFDEVKTCYNGSAPGVSGSVRFLGPSDTNAEHITLYSSFHYTRTELIIERPAYAYVGFEPGSFIISPRSNWTFYSGDNFEGNAICFSSGDKVHLEALTSKALSENMRSVVKGCYGPIDTYLTF